MQYTRASQDIVDLVQDHAAKYHPRLAGHSIAVGMKDKASMSRGRVTLGSTCLPTPKLKPFLEDGIEFLIVLPADEWGKADDRRRAAIVDHELCHCGIDPETGEPCLRPHDYEEFGEIQARHGFWRQDQGEREVQLALAIETPPVRVSTLKEA